MYRQKRVIAAVRTSSTAREKVTIGFDAEQTGVLDLKNPRAARWARIIEEQRHTNQPVYVEIDEETSLITNVRVPRRYHVERLDPDEHGNLRVRLRPSQAIHLLLRADPNFEDMRASLQAALADDSERLITETRDEHEIIDVRLPGAGAGGSSGPAPPALPDPPVSEARAVDLFNQMSSRSCSPTSPSSDCIPFLYPDNGCWVRAHIMCHLMRTGGPDMTTNPAEDPEKVWINASTVLYAPTVNHPDCHVEWGWHVAPTLMVTLSGGDDKQVVDPSLTPAPESKAAWKGRMGDPGATLTDTAWTTYNYVGDTSVVSLAQAHAYMQHFRDELADRCDDIGPPPYSCTNDCFFIIDRSTYSNLEIDAMLIVASPAVIQSAFYVVVDGFSPYDLGFTAATMQHTPVLTVSPSVAGMTITPVQLVFEYPTHLNRRQRLTWVYDVSFTNTTAFTSELIPITLQASMSTVSNTGTLYLTTQQNPYEVDGATSWLSTDLRVFQILTGQSKFNVNMVSDPNGFITQVITNLNTGNTAGQTFENDISTDQQTSRLELSATVGGTAVYNFAVAKVRYRALTVAATDVRVFFRLFPVATTSLEYNQSTAYRRHTSGTTIVPLLGITGGEVSAIPCFAEERINSATVSMTTQPDAPNLQTLPPNPSGAEVVRYFGCWLDINQPTQPQFPIAPSPMDGPYSSGRQSIQDLVRYEHQCLVSEIAFTPAPIPSNTTPSVSDKLAQRNLALGPVANPGHVNSRRIPQTFEITPSPAKLEHDELMIDWGNLPAGAAATLYIPGLDVNEIVLLAAKTYRSHRLIRIDEHTLKMATGGITYLPIPFVDANVPGLLTIDLPEGVKRGDTYKVIVRQVTGERRQPMPHVAISVPTPGVRHIVGSFQLTIPVHTKDELLPGQQRLLSNLRWIERAIPAGNRWAPVFGRYVRQVAERVDGLGGDSPKVAPSPSGQWREAYRNCLLLMLLTIVLIATLVVGAGTQSGSTALLGGIPIIALLAVVVSLWRRKCRPTLCRLLITMLAGTALGTLILTILLFLGPSTPQLVATLIAGAGLAITTAIIAWLKRCF
jgi:F0F1-type ATP synthase assembly protein I